MFLKIGKICVICTIWFKLLIFCEFMQEILSLRSRMTESGSFWDFSTSVEMTHIVILYFLAAPFVTLSVTKWSRMGLKREEQAPPLQTTPRHPKRATRVEWIFSRFLDRLGMTQHSFILLICLCFYVFILVISTDFILA